MLITDEPGRHIEASADNVADIRGNQTVVLPVSHGKQLGASQPKLEVNHLRTVSLITWKHGHRRSMPAGCRACGATRARLRHPPMCRRGGLSAWSQPIPLSKARLEALVPGQRLCCSVETALCQSVRACATRAQRPCGGLCTTNWRIPAQRTYASLR